MKNASIINGKNVLIATIDDIKMRNDTEGWDADRWEDEIGWVFQDIRDEDYGTTDFKDIMAYLLSFAENDFDFIADLVCNGPVRKIAEAIDVANKLGEECYLLQ
jgi:hypothetical protein